MNDPWTERWNERYKQEQYAYGRQPNNYLKQQLDKLKPGKILFPAEGEGRNAVYAATQGWQVSAFDISAEGRNKALQLAANQQVEIDYKVGEIETLGYDADSFDAVALIYAHFPTEIKSACHRQLAARLRKGGTVIFEAFSKKHLQYLAKNDKVGGPKEPGMLFSIDEIAADFAGFDFIELKETEIELSEGLYHNGQGAVVRFVGVKR